MKNQKHIIVCIYPKIGNLKLQIILINIEEKKKIVHKQSH